MPGQCHARAATRLHSAEHSDGLSASTQNRFSLPTDTGSEICTDGLAAYRGLESYGYRHQATVLLGKPKDVATTLLPHVHRVASLLKRWLIGTHFGGVGKDHLPYYLDEFTFRFSRRKPRTPGKLFHALLYQAVREEPAPYKTLIRPKTKPQ